jgi:hypothetical protein
MSDQDNQSAKSKLHNELTADLLKRIIEPIGNGASFSEVLVMLESLTLGVLLIGTQYHYDPQFVLNGLNEHVAKRLTESMAKMDLRRACPKAH